MNTGGLKMHHIGSWCPGRHSIWPLLFPYLRRASSSIPEAQGTLNIDSISCAIIWVCSASGNVLRWRLFSKKSLPTLGQSLTEKTKRKNKTKIQKDNKNEKTKRQRSKREFYICDVSKIIKSDLWVPLSRSHH